MASVSSSLLPSGRERRSNSARLFTIVAVSSCACLFVAAALVYGTKGVNELLTTVTSNCDGSVDITTFYPCSTAPVYTSVAPTVVAPPIYLPQTIAPAPVLAPPVPFPNYQYPGLWNGDDVLSGGNPQWAKEDSAINSAVLQNWRIRILQAKKVQADLNRQLMDIATRTTADGAAANAVVGKKGKKSAKKAGGKKLLTKKVAKLASSTAQALGSIEDQVEAGADASRKSDGSERTVKRILKQMDDMADEFRTEDAELAGDDAGDGDNDDSVVDGE